MENQSSGQQEPVWRALRHGVGAEPERSIAAWLWDRASLTQRLRSRCARFEVRVGDQCWGHASLSEGLALDVASAHRCWLRHVHLLCDGIPLVFARTVIPARTLRGRLRQLGRLGTRPLGEVLFRDPGMRRGPVEVAALHEGHRLFGAAVAGLSTSPAQIWGRRSVFWVEQRPLMVAELFLPAIVRVPAPQQW